jgi:hypothetical protein
LSGNRALTMIVSVLDTIWPELFAIMKQHGAAAGSVIGG